MLMRTKSCQARSGGGYRFQRRVQEGVRVGLGGGKLKNECNEI